MYMYRIMKNHEFLINLYNEQMLSLIWSTIFTEDIKL